MAPQHAQKRKRSHNKCKTLNKQSFTNESATNCSKSYEAVSKCNKEVYMKQDAQVHFEIKLKSNWNKKQNPLQIEIKLKSGYDSGDDGVMIWWTFSFDEKVIQNQERKSM